MQGVLFIIIFRFQFHPAVTEMFFLPPRTQCIFAQVEFFTPEILKTLLNKN